jgi:hypothetical protein
MPIVTTGEPPEPHEPTGSPDPEAGFQTAEAIGIAAVGIIVLIAVAAALESLGLEVIGWMRDSLLRG